MKKQIGSLLCIAVIFAGAAHSLAGPQADSTERSSSWLVLSHAEYLDRVRAIWTAQMIAQMTGVRFEHQPASTMPVTPLTRRFWISSSRGYLKAEIGRKSTLIFRSTRLKR